MLEYGGASKTLARAAGPGMQEECSKTYPGGIFFGDIAVTRGHKLKCKAVYHVALPPWDSDLVNALEVGIYIVVRGLKMMINLVLYILLNYFKQFHGI